MDERLEKSQAKTLLHSILENGVVFCSIPHAVERFRERQLSIIDCENVLRGGIEEDSERENGAWRHRVWKRKITVIIPFLSEEEVGVVAAWRTG